MPYLRVGEENHHAIELYFEDHGAGAPVLLIHGFPLSGQSWEKQVPVLLKAGHRVITYDRRGFGRSARPCVGYDYDTFAADLNALIERLDLRELTLVGFSMGTGEVTRYLANYGSGRVRRAALLGPLQPFLLKTPDNPDGIDASVFERIQREIRDDRYAFLKSFLDDFYNVDVCGGSRISKQAWQASWNVGADASAVATMACVGAWLTDFRDDLREIDVPVLVMQGDQDRILPIEATGARLPALIKDVRYLVVEGGPHAIGWTHADEVNRELSDFIRR